MSYSSFDNIIAEILQKDPRYHPDAYDFIRAALDHTIKTLRRGVPKRSPRRHVSAAEFLQGIRQYALQQYGPMTLSVLHHWGIHNCRDFGNIVFNLIQARIFGRSDTDKIEDFDHGYDFYEAFQKPYCPTKPLRPRPRRSRHTKNTPHKRTAATTAKSATDSAKSAATAKTTGTDP
jgi:uncharacterized repeat protein (TIGR04138 family)